MEAMAISPETTRTRTVVMYDDHCPMCTFQSRLLTRLDWFHRLEFLPISDPRVSALAPQVKREELLASMHVLTPRGKLYRGARGVRHIAARLPLLWPLCLLLWLPGCIYLSEYVYRAVARNRYVLSKFFGCQTACAVLPPQKPKS